MDEGINMGIKMSEFAYDYYCGKISRQACEETIAGNNLDTGQIRTHYNSNSDFFFARVTQASFQSAKAARYFSLYSLRVDTK